MSGEFTVVRRLFLECRTQCHDVKNKGRIELVKRTLEPLEVGEARGSTVRSRAVQIAALISKYSRYASFVLGTDRGEREQHYFALTGSIIIVLRRTGSRLAITRSKKWGAIVCWHYCGDHSAGTIFTKVFTNIFDRFMQPGLIS
jgi:hypothetical protein